jgi:hypothetical protein
MALPARAGIDLAGHEFRYAVVHVGRSGNRLLRLGECSFDFDTVEVLGPRGQAADRDIFLDGLREALGPTPPPALRFVVHPPVATTFLSVPEGEDAETAAHRDARLLGLLDDEGMTVRIDHLDGHHGVELVTLLPRDLRDAVAEVCAKLGCAAFEIVPGLLATGELMRELSTDNETVVGVGVYDAGLEVVVLEGGLWRVGTSAAAVGGTRPEAFTRTLESGLFLAAERILRFRYGSTAAAEVAPGLEDHVPFDGLRVLQYDAGGVDPTTDPSLFTAAVGAAIL